jgi:hypothetical protein
VPISPIASLTPVQICRMFGFTLMLYAFSPSDSHLGTCSIKDKDGQVPLDYVPKDDEETRKAFRRRQVENSVSRDDIASGTCFMAVRSIPGLISHRRRR